MPLSLDNIRIGKKYHLKNYGETAEFIAEERKSENDFLVKDLNSLEIYRLKDLIKYGLGKDFDLYEIN